MKYDVHLYREMRLLFEGIWADSPQAAAEIASRKHLPEAVEVDDCEGRNFTAEVVEPGRSTNIDFSAREGLRPIPRSSRGAGERERGR